MSEPSLEPKSTTLAEVMSLMRRNQVRSGDFTYTRPAPMTYEQQWLWDSCFHALIYAHFDPNQARQELLSLLHPPGFPDSRMIPHMIYWTGGGLELWGYDHVSFLTQPPMVADTALRLHRRDPNVPFLRRIYSRLQQHYEWLNDARDPDGDGLVSIIHPWESGWDASPRWDGALNLIRPTPHETKAARLQLAKELRENGTDAREICETDRFVIEPVDFNSIYAVNLSALADIAGILGRDQDAAIYKARAVKTAEAIRNRMWDPQTNRFCDLAGEGEKPIRVSTPAALFPLFNGIASDSQLEHCLRQFHAEFSEPFPVPTVSPREASYSPDQYWRGSVWLSVNWFIHQALLSRNLSSEARMLATKSRHLVDIGGFFEYYDSRTGDGLGAADQSWAGLVIEFGPSGNLVGGR
ncbi:MAG: amylo-alpha-1,6-glucosidase [Limisphaerales bacterium]